MTADEPEKAIVCCMLTEFCDPQLDDDAMSMFGIGPGIVTECADCKRSITVSPASFGFNTDGTIAIPPADIERVHVCAYCMADRMDAEGQWEEAVYYRYMADEIERNHHAGR